MVRRRSFVTEDKIEKRLKEGYGVGEGLDYKSLIVVQNFSSKGRMYRIKGCTTKRTYHLFSDLERSAFFSFDRSEFITDIREQFPLLPLEETVEIAKKLGVKHPAHPHTKYPIVMTTDLLLTVGWETNKTFRPVNVKYTTDLGKQRVREKKAIEECYWAATPRNLNLEVFTEENVHPAFNENMRWVHPVYWIEDLYPLTKSDVFRIAHTLTPLVLEEDLPLWLVAKRCDQILKLEPGTSLFVIRHLIATSCWEVDMYSPINTQNRLVLTNSHKDMFYDQRRLVA